MCVYVIHVCIDIYIYMYVYVYACELPSVFHKESRAMIRTHVGVLYRDCMLALMKVLIQDRCPLGVCQKYLC